MSTAAELPLLLVPVASKVDLTVMIGQRINQLGCFCQSNLSQRIYSNHF